MTDTINLLYEIIQLITPPDTGKSPPTAYRFSQLKQGTYLIRLKCYLIYTVSYYNQSVLVIKTAVIISIRNMCCCFYISL